MSELGAKDDEIKLYLTTYAMQANLELKERMDSALEREERAKAELQDNKDQVNNRGWSKNISRHKRLTGGASGVPCA